MTDQPDDVDLVDEDLDTTDGTRDPLSTDDGLAAAAEGMPEVPERDVPPGEDSAYDDVRPLLYSPGLDVTDDGDDPCAHLGADDGEG